MTHDLVSSEQSAASWTPPSNWTGPSAVLYKSFDSSDCLVLMEGKQATSDPVALMSGKVSYHVLYQKFDSSAGFVLVEGTQAKSDSAPLVSGKVSYIMLSSIRALTVQIDWFRWKELRLAGVWKGNIHCAVPELEQFRWF